MNKYSAPCASEPAQGADGECSNQFQHIRPADESQAFLVADYLNRGKEHATSARDLAALLSWPLRAITRAIERERRAGVPILACDRGYFLPAGDAETDEYLGRLSHREREIARTRAAVAQSRQVAIDLEGGARNELQ